MQGCHGYGLWQLCHSLQLRETVFLCSDVSKLFCGTKHAIQSYMQRVIALWTHMWGSGAQHGDAGQCGQTALKREAESVGSLPEAQENVV